MIDTSGSVTINRPVEEVFAYVSDTSDDPAWHTDVLEARKTTDGPIGMGTIWHSRFKPSMGISEGEMEVVAFETNRREVLRGVIGPMEPTLTYLFEPADARNQVHSARSDQGVRHDEAHGAAHEAHDPQRQHEVPGEPQACSRGDATLTVGSVLSGRSRDRICRALDR